MTLSDMTNGTSALASEDGPLPSCAPDMPSSVEYFQSLRHANLTARQASEWGLLTSGIYGPRATTTSDISDLESLLVSRYQASLPSNGGGLYRTTFKRRDIGLSRSIPAWRASAARTSDNGCTGWPTPSTPSGGQTVPEGTTASGMTPDGRKLQVTLGNSAALAGWPTPRQADGEKNVRSAAGSASEMERKGGPQDMSMAVSLCGWSTPTSRDHKDGAPCPNVPINGLLGRTVWLSGWPTPVTHAKSGGEYADPAKAIARAQSNHANDLRDWVHLSGPIRYTVHGEMLTGSSARMASGGQLNPALPRWLMAFPAEWERSAPGWSSWSIWQDVMHAAYVMQSDTA